MRAVLAAVAAILLLDGVSVAGESPYNPNAKSRGPLRGWCWEASNDYVAYFSRVETYHVGQISGVEQEFAKFIEKTYGLRGVSASCFGSYYPGQAEIVRQRTIDDIKRSAPAKFPVKFVELDWAPAPTAAAPAAAPAQSAPTAPAASAQNAYEKALAAQRPRSVGSSAPPRARTADADADVAPRLAAAVVTQAAPTYSYCSANGTPTARSKGPVHQHFYVTQPFPLAAGQHPDGAFQNFLRAAHPGEIFTARCSTAGPLATVENSRRVNIGGKQKNPYFDIQEVRWQP